MYIYIICCANSMGLHDGAMLATHVYMAAVFMQQIIVYKYFPSSVGIQLQAKIVPYSCQSNLRHYLIAHCWHQIQIRATGSKIR